MFLFALLIKTDSKQKLWNQHVKVVLKPAKPPTQATWLNIWLTHAHYKYSLCWGECVIRKVCY